MNTAAKIYLQTCRVIGQSLDSNSQAVLVGPDSTPAVNHYGRILRKLSEARVFDVGSDIVGSVTAEMSEQIVRGAGCWDDYQAWLNRDDKTKKHEGIQHLTAEYAEDLLCQLPFPVDLLPFPVCWFGFGSGVVSNLNDDLHLSIRDQKHNGRSRQKMAELGAEEDALFAGVLVSGEGGGWVEAVFLVPTDTGWGFATIEWARDGRWTDWRTYFSPWLIWAIINILHDGRQIVMGRGETTLGWRREFQRTFGPLKLPAKPKPYYEVVIEPHIVQTRLQAEYAGTKVWTHRHDRRAHEKCRVLRGDLPIPHAYKIELVKRGYAVYDTINPTHEDAARIAVRGFRPKEHSEWIAILPYWVQACVVGPEDMPYVPSVHVVKEAVETR